MQAVILKGKRYCKRALNKTEEVKESIVLECVARPEIMNTEEGWR